jgi:hypothetical protein
MSPFRSAIVPPIISAHFAAFVVTNYPAVIRAVNEHPFVKAVRASYETSYNV